MTSQNNVSSSHTIDGLNRSDSRYRAFIETIPQPVITVDNDETIISINTAVSRLLGYQPDDLVGTNINTLVSLNLKAIQDNQHRVYGDSPEPLVLGKKENISVTCKDGCDVFVEIGISHFDEDKSFFVLCFYDVNARKLVELELSRSNKELNQFAYIASHDLKAPLRGIDNLATWIWEDIDDKDTVIDHVQLMRLRIQRMQCLLDDLLEYSRVGQLNSDIDSVNISHLIHDLFAQSTPPEEFTLSIHGDTDPIDTMATPLAIVLRNILSNAIKYNDKAQGHITVRLKNQADTIILSVHDNGPGIAEIYHEKIFGMFERLSSKDDIEGSGMGLALVKKIVESFGGSITLTSEEDRGTTFTITWVKQPRAHQ